MKTIPIALQAAKSSALFKPEELLRVGPLKDGTVYGFTSLDRDETYDDGNGAVTYRAHTGFSGSAMTAAADLSVDNAEAETLFGTFTVPGVTQEQIDLGLFDNAPYVLYLVDYDNLANGHEVISSGTIGAQRTKHGMFAMLELRSTSQQAKQSIVDLTSLTCRCKKFGSQPGDERFPCGYDIDPEWENFTVSALGDEVTRQFNTSDLSQAQDFFAPGVVDWLTGANAGTQVEVESFGPTPQRYHALLHFGGANGSTSFPDDTGRTWTVSGNAQVSTAWAALGSGSLLLDGSLDYIATADSADFHFGTGMFTVQCFYKPDTAATNAAIIGKWAGTSGARGWILYLNAGSLYFRFSESGSGTLRDVVVAWTPVAGQAYHLAASRDTSGVVRLFIDGVVVAQATRPQAVNNGTGTVRVGHANDLTAAYYVDGYIDEVAITKGLCLYAGNFTPPAVPLALRTGGDVTQLFGVPAVIDVGDTGRIRRDCTREWEGHNSCETYWGTDKGLHFRGEPHLQPGDPVQVPGAET